MLWMELTSDAFAKAVEDSSGLCLLPLGCVERHGPHLPVGTDQIVVDEVSRRAAEIEPAVVFPSYYFGQIAEARHYPGTVSLAHDLLLRLMRAALDEIARNGFDKILIVNGHGGNEGLLSYLMMSLLQEPRDYVTYAVHPWNLEPDDRKKLEEMRETKQGGHADEMETSAIMYLRPGLVHMENITEPESGRPRGRQKGLGGLLNPFGWYSNYPTHYAGDARPARPEKGEFVLEASVRKVVNAERAIKADKATPEMQREFYGKARKPLGR